MYQFNLKDKNCRIKKTKNYYFLQQVYVHNSYHNDINRKSLLVLQVMFQVHQQNLHPHHKNTSICSQHPSYIYSHGRLYNIVNAINSTSVTQVVIVCILDLTTIIDISIINNSERKLI